EAAVAGEDEPFRLDMLQRFSDEIGHFLRALNLKRTMADDPERDLLVFRNHLADMFKIHPSIKGALDREDVDVGLIEAWQRRFVGLILARDSLCGRTAPACVAPHFTFVA